MVELERQNTYPVNNTTLIAPCGIYCGVCKTYLRKKNKCRGCRADTDDIPVTRARCKIKKCVNLKNNNGFCGEVCVLFPCADIKRLDARYRKKYNTDIYANLHYLYKNGPAAFLKKEKKKHKCLSCGGVVCIHTGECFECGNAGARA
ncbi:MAG: DUF3795 domain-containing protein [Bacteroidetes bacterium]|nr:DUF3795 domain-containing protein [Bacteroidota bacterium]